MCMRIVSQDELNSVDFNEHSVLTIRSGDKRENSYVLFITTRIGAKGIVLATFSTRSEAIQARQYIEAAYTRRARNLDLSEEGWRV